MWCRVEEMVRRGAARREPFVGLAFANANERTSRERRTKNENRNEDKGRRHMPLRRVRESVR